MYAQQAEEFLHAPEVEKKFFFISIIIEYHHQLNHLILINQNQVIDLKKNQITHHI